MNSTQHCLVPGEVLPSPIGCCVPAACPWGFFCLDGPADLFLPLNCPIPFERVIFQHQNQPVVDHTDSLSTVWRHLFFLLVLSRPLVGWRVLLGRTDKLLSSLFQTGDPWPVCLSLAQVSFHTLHYLCCPLRCFLASFITAGLR